MALQAADFDKARTAILKAVGDCLGQASAYQGQLGPLDAATPRNVSEGERRDRQAAQDIYTRLQVYALASQIVNALEAKAGP